MWNLLDQLPISLFNPGQDVTLNWLGSLILKLIEGVGIVGVGIIVFTLILKAITLPLDIYQKVSSRKQSLKMKQMRPQLEKLQKQYANDQQMYSRKMMELYKQNHYSMFGACLPSIIMMVIFIVVFGQFNSYSQYANLNTYNRMIDSYNAAIEDCIVERESAEDGFIVVNADGQSIVIDGVEYIDYVSKDEDRFIFLRVNALYEEDGIIRADANTEYYIDTDKMLAYDARRAEVEALVKTDVEEGETAVTLQDACKLWVQTKGREAAKVTFEENDHSFLWIKNIWYPDTTLANPVRSYSEFVNSISAKVQIGDTKYKITEYPSSPYQNETAYNEITYLLGEQKSEGNGYFILIVLSIGTMLLSQFIMSRMQKDQTELQSADGSGQRSMKMMMIIMPVMYGFFSFSYSSSFSIYMVTSNVCGILTSLVTTWIVDLIFKKNEDKQFREKYESRYRASKGILENNSQKKK